MPTQVLSTFPSKKLEPWGGKFREIFLKSRQVQIVTGYVSSDSLFALAELIKRHPSLEKIELIVGMAGKDGLTANQKLQLSELNLSLLIDNTGEIKVPISLPVHAKVAIFDQKEFILGSSNLSGLEIEASNIEVDIWGDEPAAVQNTQTIFNDLWAKSLNYQEAEAQISTITVQEDFLSGFKEVQRVDKDVLEGLGELDLRFELPLKDGEKSRKSNLNASFAAPRKSGGSPRNWFEVEIIVPKPIRELPGFPSKREGNENFVVFTDDGYSFECHMSGTGGKNFASTGDLTILGRWIKGRLINSGSIGYGELYTADVAASYGRTSLSLIKLDLPDTWLLSYEQPERLK